MLDVYHSFWGNGDKAFLVVGIVKLGMRGKINAERATAIIQLRNLHDWE